MDASQSNTFLASLPEEERQRVVAAGELVSLPAGSVLHRSGGVIDDAWFPIDSVGSLHAKMQDGAEAEVAIIGPEGLLGVTALLGGAETTWNEAAVQIGGELLRVPIDSLNRQAGRTPMLRLLLQRWAQALLVQTSQTAACNRFHSLDQRLARCLLVLDDRVRHGEIAITHERLASLLGSLRPGVTVAAQRLQEQEIIDYRRGRIRIVERNRLEQTACECYGAVAAEYQRLLGPESLQQLSATAAVPDETLRELNSRLLVSAIREQAAREQAEEVNDVTTRFFAALSHELRTPLASILGWSQLLQSRELDDDTIKLAIETIRQNAEAQKHLVDEMLDLARLRTGQLQLNVERLDIGTAVSSAVASSRPAADAASIAISVITGEPVLADADPVRLQQILTNLLSNAVKFTPRGGSIEVAVVATEFDVRIHVRDSGRGIEPDLLPYVFDSFRQGAPAPSGELGMGLGLAIVRQLVTVHGGTVDVQSEGTTKGATFTIVLPRGA
jgi:signal transduction histidine kinase